jgi:putative restriction endonuclease
MASGKKWTRSELLVALNLYHKLNFGQLHSRQPAIIQLAEKLGRSSGSVAMTLCNVASLDPSLKIRGIKGLDGVSALDRSAWDEFHENLNETVPASENELRKLFSVDENSEIELIPKVGISIKKTPPAGPTEIQATVNIRRGQSYFRTAVLNNFGGRCGISLLAVRELLIASHILPWGSNVHERLNLRNGLALSRLHDAAFDQGLIAFDDDYRLLLSPRLKTEISNKSVADNFGVYAGAALNLPEDAILPDPEFLTEHRKRIFKAV